MSQFSKQMLGGMKWTSMSMVVNTVVQLVQFAILARLLSPADFGLMSMLLVIIVFSQVFSDVGVSSALIHFQDASRKQLSTLYWLNIIAGWTISVLVYLSSPLIANFYQEPRLEQYVPYIAIIFLVTPFGQQFQFLLQKKLRFNTLAKIEIASIVTGSTSAILLAFLGHGVMSLIVGQIVTNSVKSILNAVRGWKEAPPLLYFNFKEVKHFLSFGVFEMGSRSVNYVSSNMDYLLIGRYLGPEALGIYTLAYQLITIPVTKINPIVTKVAFPVFSKNQHDHPTLQKGFTQISQLLSYVTVPMLIGLMATADVLVPVIFGNGWEASIPVVQVLAVLGILRVLMNLNGSILLAKGKANIAFFWVFRYRNP
ncbi:MOP flippase family protein [Bacillus coahuilensis]|uniref:MOP flippase family protein n=1 Tax=Bacillus coahuilensis TaxID=408580 RepID=UPI000305A97C|nr:MOP flippase family protein [Bacillus coahuilensis]